MSTDTLDKLATLDRAHTDRDAAAEAEALLRRLGLSWNELTLLLRRGLRAYPNAEREALPGWNTIPLCDGTVLYLSRGGRPVEVYQRDDGGWVARLNGQGLTDRYGRLLSASNAGGMMALVALVMSGCALGEESPTWQ